MVTTRSRERKKAAAAAKAAVKPSSRITRYSVPRRMVLTREKESTSKRSEPAASTLTSKTTQAQKLTNTEHTSRGITDFFENARKRNEFPDLSATKLVPSRFYVNAIDNYKRKERWGGTRWVDGRRQQYVLVGPRQKDEVKHEIKLETYWLWKAPDKEEYLKYLMKENKLWFQKNGRKYLDWSTIDLMVDTDWKLLRFVPPRYYDHEAVRRGMINATTKSEGKLVDYLFKNNLWKK